MNESTMTIKEKLSPVASSADGPTSRARTCGHGVRAELHVRRAAARPPAARRRPAGGPPLQPAVLGLLLGAAAGDALPEDRRHRARLLGHDAAPQVVGRRQTHGAVLGPGPGLLGPLSGLRAVREPRAGAQTHPRFALRHHGW